jgi:hypothetical protein
MVYKAIGNTTARTLTERFSEALRSKPVETIVPWIRSPEASTNESVRLVNGTSTATDGFAHCNTPYYKSYIIFRFKANPEIETTLESNYKIKEFPMSGHSKSDRYYKAEEMALKDGPALLHIKYNGQIRFMEVGISYPTKSETEAINVITNAMIDLDLALEKGHVPLIERCSRPAAPQTAQKPSMEDLGRIMSELNRLGILRVTLEDITLINGLKETGSWSQSKQMLAGRLYYKIEENSSYAATYVLTKQVDGINVLARNQDLDCLARTITEKFDGDIQGRMAITAKPGEVFVKKQVESEISHMKTSLYREYHHSPQITVIYHGGHCQNFKTVSVVIHSQYSIPIEIVAKMQNKINEWFETSTTMKQQTATSSTEGRSPNSQLRSEHVNTAGILP